MSEIETFLSSDLVKNISESSLIDFLTNNIYDLLPDSWKQSFNSLNIPEHQILTFPYYEADVFNDSLREFFNNCIKFSIPRVPSPELESLELSTEESTGMNPKKKLEVEICAPLIHDLCNKYNNSHTNINPDDLNEIKLIVDIGAGLGYLSRILARKYGYKVIGLENREDIVIKSNKNNEKNLKFVKDGSFQSYCLNITPETTCKDIEDIIISEFGKIIPYIIIGLHCCGDLSVYIINLFLHQISNNCKGFFFIGCCYNLLNNFPLSEKYKNISLNYHQKNIACQLLLNSSSITPEEKILSIKVLYYRSLFQIHLKSINHLAYQHPQNYKISKIKPEYTDSFIHYFKYCVDKLKIECPSDDYINNLEIQYKFKDFVIYYSLRNSLTDVFESIIIIDRIEYIKSVTNNVEYIPLFPVNISPRNIAIMSTLCLFNINKQYDI